MSDVVEATQAVADGAVEGGASFGRRLAAERERLGLSIDDIAARLRLNPKQVQAIESESLPPLPTPFLRGFVRNYAKELKLDPAPVLAELDARISPPVEQPEHESATSSGSRAALGEHFSKRLVLGGVIGALVVFALIGWFASTSQPSETTATAPNTVPMIAPAPAPLQPAAEAAPAIDTAQPPIPEPEVANTPAAPPAAASEPLHLVFREQSWVEVTQADGRIVHSQINEAGTEQRIDGKVPLRLVIGNASAVSVEYKGAPVDLKPVTSVDNVARITLN